ncbi:aspartyl-phosphate phosphatase Spo0E family protein [Paenibacillus sp. IITD108]|uniref:aspartyl-phosphate phosphatase Spo0E family protein n=1 Tax=Paenibacillus sp. IITD108 TaxID=3116649 RepID=UPI002F4253F8
MTKIETLRSELAELIQQRGLQDSLVIKKSQQLDNLIVLYMKEIPQRKAASAPLKRLNRIKMNYISRIENSLKKELEHNFERAEQLSKDVEELTKHYHLFDPVVMEKSRELDQLIMSSIKLKK